MFTERVKLLLVGLGMGLILTSPLVRAVDTVAVRGPNQEAPMFLSLNGTQASGGFYARCDSSGNLKVSLASSSGSSSSIGTPATISVGNTATVLLALNATRKGFYIVNNDATNGVFVGNASVISGATAASHGGVYLAPNGGTWYESPAVYTGAISGITASSTAIVAVVEEQ